MTTTTISTDTFNRMIAALKATREAMPDPSYSDTTRFQRQTLEQVEAVLKEVEHVERK